LISTLKRKYTTNHSFILFYPLTRSEGGETDQTQQQPLLMVPETTNGTRVGTTQGVITDDKIEQTNQRGRKTILQPIFKRKNLSADRMT
jgi:hypothetical protein